MREVASTKRLCKMSNFLMFLSMHFCAGTSKLLGEASLASSGNCNFPANVPSSSSGTSWSASASFWASTARTRPKSWSAQAKADLTGVSFKGSVSKHAGEASVSFSQRFQASLEIHLAAPTRTNFPENQNPNLCRPNIMTKPTLEDISLHVSRI